MKALLLTPVLFLAACSDPAKTCSSYGFEPGTEAYANCQLQVSQDNSARSARMADAMRGMTLQGSNMQPSGIRTCRPLAGGAVQCY